jgi:hypothetical protein
MFRKEGRGTTLGKRELTFTIALLEALWGDLVVKACKE